MTRDRRRVLAAPMLGDRGGGVGQVSALIWRAMQDAWGGDAALVTLLHNGHALPGLGDKLRFGASIAGQHLAGRPEWVLFSHLGLAQVERFVPTRLATPYAVFLHGIECWSPLPAPTADVLRRARLRLANSAYTARRATAANPNLGDIVVCPLALPPHTEIPDASVARSDRTVLVVGRLSASERYKGHEQLLRAWPEVAARIAGARLVIAGDGDDAPRLRAFAAAQPGQGLVDFLGFVPRERLALEYAQATAFAMPSRGEGFGLVYLEAMAHGLPCLGSVHDAASEVIVDGETGVLVDPDDRAQLAEALCGLLDRSDRARAMGDAGRRRVQSQFMYPEFQRRLTGLLGDAFEDRPGASV